MADIQFTPPDRPPEIPENAWRILNAAVKLFAQKGYAATSVREIVQEADVTSPMLYYYFDSKEGLFRNLTLLMQREFRRDLQRAIDKADDLPTAIQNIIEVHFRGVRESPAVVRFLYSLLFGTSGSCPTHDLFKNHQETLALVEQVFAQQQRAGVHLNFEPTWLAAQLLALVNSHTMRLVKELELQAEPVRAAWLADQTNATTVRQLAEFFLHGAICHTKTEG